MANPSDTTYSIVREVVFGTTPATPAFKSFDYIPGSDLSYDMKSLNSDVLKQNRAAAGYRKVGGNVSGSLKSQLRRDTNIDMLIESIVGGAFTTNVAKGGNTDFSHTIEKKMVDSGNSMYWRYTGVQVSKLGITASSDSNAEVSFDFVGMGSPLPTSAIITGATYTAPTQGTLLTGLDFGTITVAGLTAVFSSLDFSIDQTREAQPALGSAYAVGVGASGNRAVKLTLKLYRKDISPETLFYGDTPVAVSFSIGTGANGYKIDLPVCVAATPKNEVSGSSALVSIDLMAQYDPVSGTDVMFTRLT